MFDAMFSHVQTLLRENGDELVKIDGLPFRKRSEHIKRVFMWCERLSDCQHDRSFDRDALLTAAMFHDAGYSLSGNGENHAKHSAEIFILYAKEHNPPVDCAFTERLIRLHSDKHLMYENDTPLELLLLMEADLLDETGALSIVWDCMSEGATCEQSFQKTYEHICAYSMKAFLRNPMVTAGAKRFWEEKRALTCEFVRQLSFDLGI